VKYKIIKSSNWYHCLVQW